MGGIDPAQERIRVITECVGARRETRISIGSRTERDERSVDVEEQQRPLRGAGHGGTIATTGSGIRIRIRSENGIRWGGSLSTRAA
ncbi:hypothetical protein OG401_01250 [Kitasatospora purpeofusca]|uniref:hypothetical protein n=1 Tax=Kitasatospora purpeofusca TaxID=67352 RepID=UPI0022581E1F|nr:hypothetical protein [Kitasatospora purpeofusca]MCX4682946.1 hypothetical protein [Kitasatospora purpeofusca]